MSFSITSDLDSEIGRLMCGENFGFNACTTRSDGSSIIANLTLLARKGQKKCTRAVNLKYRQNHENKINPVKIVTRIEPVAKTGFVLDPNSDTLLENSLR